MSHPHPQAFCMTLSPRWGDMDAMNHVNNAVYLRYLEEARIQWLNAQHTAWFDDRHVPVLAQAMLNYRLPITYPSTLLIELFTRRIGNSSLTVGHRIKDQATGRLHCDGEVVVVWIDRTSGQASSLPEAVREAAEKIATA
ncbi:thioesterase [Lysobacteraceae bacterium NML120232]|nr:thioesterase [Xanthomonadaceae bacterium NML120232]